MRGRRGQITIFVILGILIVVAIAMIFVLYDNTKPDKSTDAEQNPEGNIEACVKDQVEKAVDLIFENNGYVEESEFVKEFKGEKVPYLCYTEFNYVRCIVKEPVLIEHLEVEIYDYINPKIGDCFESLKDSLERKGYDVEYSGGFEFEVDLIPGAVKTTINRKLSIEKTGEPKRFENYEVRFQSSLFDVANIVHEIIRQETLYCNSEYVELMRNYPHITIEKYQTGDLETVYTIEDTRANKIFKFAVRGCNLEVPK